MQIRHVGRSHLLVQPKGLLILLMSRIEGRLESRLFINNEYHQHLAMSERKSQRG
jgi:hypothetical protein